MKATWLNIIKGDRTSFLKLYDTYYTPLFHYGMTIRRDRELVKESLHILFCELWERHERLPQTTVDPKFYLFTWLKRIIIRRSEERRVGQGVDLGGRRIIKKKKEARKYWIRSTTI